MVYFSKLKITIVLLIALFGIVFAAPNALDRGTADAIPAWLPKKQVSLGLDLQGGSHLLLEVGVDTVLKERIDALKDSIRTRIRPVKPRILLAQNDQPGGVSVRIKNASDLDSK